MSPLREQDVRQLGGSTLTEADPGWSVHQRTLSRGEQQRLENLCRIFRIQLGATRDNPQGAVYILNHLYAMPTIAQQSPRREYGMSILRAVNEEFPPAPGRFTSAFQGQVLAHVGSIQTSAGWYASLNRPPRELAQKYEYLSHVAFWLRVFGVGAGGSAMAAGVAEGIKKGTVWDGIERAVRRFLGEGAILEEARKRWGARFAWLRGPVGIAIVAGGSIAYVVAVEQMEEIRAVLLHGFQNRQVSEEDYRRVLSEIDPNRIVRYDER